MKTGMTDQEKINTLESRVRELEIRTLALEDVILSVCKAVGVPIVRHKHV